MNTHHGDTEARRNVGLLYEALTESGIRRFYFAPGDSAPGPMTFPFLRVSVALWWVLFRRSGNA